MHHCTVCLNEAGVNKRLFKFVRKEKNLSILQELQLKKPQNRGKFTVHKNFQQ